MWWLIREEEWEYGILSGESASTVAIPLQDISRSYDRADAHGSHQPVSVPGSLVYGAIGGTR